MAFDPSDKIDSGVNLDETPVLEDLFPTSTPRPEITQQNNGVGAELVPQKPAQPEQSGEVLEPETKDVSRPGRLQERINKLVRKAHEKEEENGRLNSQLAALTQTVAALQGQLSQASQARFGPAEVRDEGLFPTGSDPFATEKPTAAPAGTDVVRLVKAAVQEAVAPLYQKTQRDVQVAQLMQAHENSFREAIEEYPELTDVNSELRKTFNDLFNNTPDLNPVPNKPLLVATMARGLVADARRGEQKDAARKRAAAVVAPTAAPTDIAGTDAWTPSKATVAAVEAAKERIRNGQQDFQDYKLLRMVASRQQAASQRK